MFNWGDPKKLEDQKKKKKILRMFQTTLAAYLSFDYSRYGADKTISDYTEQYIYDETGKFVSDMTLEEVKIEYDKLKQKYYNFKLAESKDN